MPRLTRKPARNRALIASARTVQVGNERDALAIRRMRQPWQPQAWAYRDAVGEVGYAMRFLANANSRMRLYAAACDPDDPNANPVPIDEADGIPSSIAAPARDAMAELGASQLALSGLIKPLTENMEVPGECFLVSDPAVIEDQLWSIRSMDELLPQQDGTYLLRDEPAADSTASSIQPQGRPLSKDAYVARMWTPHPRYHNWADSPMRQLIDTCDELLLLSRSIRGVARSRLAGSGILAVAEEFSIQRQGDQETDDDPDADPFMDELTQTIITAIRDEGSAAAVVPVLLRGPAPLIKDGIQFIPFERKMDDKAVGMRSELIGRIASGLDLPKEIITGTADMNHWSAWQVDDNTFRHHIEPKVLTMVDCLTVAFLRPWLVAAGVPVEVADRIVVWYDPTELVTHPDRTKDALDVWDRFGISNETLRDVAGWSDEDAPPIDEVLLRMLSKERTFPPTIVEALFNHFAPTLRILPDKNEPGVGPGDATEPPDATTPAPGEDPKQITQGPPPASNGNAPAPTGGQAPRMQALTAAGKPNQRLSRRLANIDRSLRDRLVAACDAAVRRALERAGNKARAKAPNAVKSSLSGVPAGQIPATLGQDRVRGFGLDDDALLDDQFDQLRQSWDAWVDSANRQALTTITTLTGISVDDPRLSRARARQEQAQAAGWAFLAAALRARAHQLLYNPDPNNPGPAAHDMDHTVVTVGVVRAAIAVAGGYGTGLTDPGVTHDGRPADGSAQPVPGVTSGPIATDLATDGGASIAGYIWSHGATEHPLEAHLDLDDTPFTDWNSDDLKPGDDAGWMGIGNYFPGDHDGCSCDVTVEWTEPAAAEGAAVASGALNGRYR